MRKIIALLLAVMLVLIPAGSVLAATSDTVTITMTGGLLSITATSTPDPYDFGTVVQDATYASALTAFTVENDGTVEVDITIHGANTTCAGTPWTLQANPGADIYALDFSRDASPGWTEFTTADVDYMYDLPATGTDTDDFGLQLWTPVTITDTTNLQTAVITLTASQSLAVGPG
jgi:hypothetical protein